MSNPTPSPQDDSPETLRAWACKRLGPSSERRLADADTQREVRRRLESGAELEDAVLGALHGCIADDPRVADEFAAFFMLDLMQMGRLSMSASSRLRRFLDTGDLVISVFGDMWGDLAELEFSSRAQFTSLFARRMSWKAADQARQLATQRRAEDKRVPQQPDELDLTDNVSSTPAHAIRREEHERLILLLLRLRDKDRKLLTLHLKGKSIDDIAHELGLTYHAARMALKRAIDQARALAEAEK